MQWYRNGSAIAGATGNTYAAGQEGTYSALLSTPACSGLATNTALVSVQPLPTGTITPAQATICPNTPRLLTATGALSYQWSFNGAPIAGATAQTYLAETPGVYKVVVGDGLCSAELSPGASLVKGVVPPGVKYPLLRVAANKPYPLQARSGGQAYSWLPATDLNGTGIANPVLTATQSREYRVTIIPPTGCPFTDIQEVEVFGSPAVYVPSAFTPDDDGLNDLLRPLPVHFKEIKNFKVFNRWGVLVFQTTVKDAGWDGRYGGKPQPVGTYVWLFEGVDVEGKSFSVKGVSTLLR